MSEYQIEFLLREFLSSHENINEIMLNSVEGILVTNKGGLHSIVSEITSFLHTSQRLGENAHKGELDYCSLQFFNRKILIFPCGSDYILSISIGTDVKLHTIFMSIRELCNKICDLTE